MPGFGAASVTAHGVGERADLPIPFSFVLVGAAAAIVVSFAVLAVAWRQPRFRADDEGGWPAPVWITSLIDSSVVQTALRVIGLLALGFTVLTAFIAPDDFSNPTAGLVFVVFWLGLVPASLVFGPVWRALNPVRTLHLLVARGVGRRPADAGLRPLPVGVGYWPAAAGLLGFSWLELAAPDRDTTAVLGRFLITYVVASLVGAVVFGSRWLDRGDPFEVFSALIGRLSAFGRRADGRVVVRTPLANLAGLRPAPGLAATVCVLLGSTAYDSLAGSPDWVRWTQSSALGPTVAGTAGLLIAVALVYGAYLLATALAGQLSRVRGVAGELAHSVVPIVLGYFVAHYLTLFVIEGQRTLIAASDPFSNGSDWLGTAGRAVDAWIAQDPTVVAVIQVAAIVTGHVLGAVSAHDRSVRIFPRSRAAMSQLPLLVLMVLYTLTGLLLLFSA